MPLANSWILFDNSGLKPIEIVKFNDLKKIIGSSTTERIDEIKINNLGMDGVILKKAEGWELYLARSSWMLFKEVASFSEIIKPFWAKPIAGWINVLKGSLA